MKRRRDVAVIGAGVSGLTAAKELLDEGHRVTCFEQSDSVGGIFAQRGGASYANFKLTVSQYFMAFSSMPPDLSESPSFWTKAQYLRYLHDYARRHDLLSRIRFGTRVTHIRASADAGVSVRSVQDGREESHEFDAVAVCQGAFRGSAPRIPEIAGRQSFRGDILHTADYSGPEPFRGKRVVCVGLGETAADVAREIAGVTAECFLSIRRRSLLGGRYPFGRSYTTDAYTSRLLYEGLNPHLYRERLRPTLPAHYRFIADWNAQSPALGENGLMTCFLQKNDDFVDAVLAGDLEIIDSAVSEIREHSVVFENGQEQACDAIVLCTGYQEAAIPEEWFSGARIDNVRDLYKHAFSPVLGDRVAFIGWARPAVGGVPACAEMVARYFSLLCSNERQLPADLDERIEHDKEREDNKFVSQPYMKTLVQYIPYLDSIASHIGCEPRLEDYLDDPALLYKLVCGPCIAASYRLRGPHAMPDLARKTLDRVLVPWEHDDVREHLAKSLAAKRYVPADVQPRVVETILRFLDEQPQA